MIKNENCPCIKVNCKFHGLCKECREKHKDSLPSCKSGKMFIIK